MPPQLHASAPAPFLESHWPTCSTRTIKVGDAAVGGRPCKHTRTRSSAWNAQCASCIMHEDSGSDAQIVSESRHQGSTIQGQSEGARRVSINSEGARYTRPSRNPHGWQAAVLQGISAPTRSAEGYWCCHNCTEHTFGNRVYVALATGVGCRA